MEIDNTLVIDNALVIGGAGFIGSNLSNTLSEMKIPVTVLDNLSTGNKSNLHRDINLVVGQSPDIKNLFKLERFSHVFHFGEYSRVEQSFLEFDKVFDYNIRSFGNILSYCSETSAKLIYSASSTSLTEERYRGKSLSPYTLSKNINAALLRNYSQWFNLEYVILYFYNVYGSNEISRGKYATVVAKYLELLARGAKSLPVNAPGTQKRHFTHIEDVISGVILAAKLGHGDDFCIGAEEAFSIIELVNLLGAEPDIVNSPRGNRRVNKQNLLKIKELGWTQNYNLETYIRDKKAVTNS